MNIVDKFVILQLDVESDVGPLRVQVCVRSAADRHCFGGEPITYFVDSAVTPAEFRVDGHPYGGFVEVRPNGSPVVCGVYRASCFGRRVAEGVSADIMAAAARAMAPHADAVTVALRAYQIARAVDAAAHWGAEVERLRLELSVAERNLADATRAACAAHGLDVPPDPCDDAVDAKSDQP